ncbi:hypothetical protein AAZV13_01G052100 [Glycine max]
MSITSPAPSGRVNHVNNFDFLSFCFSPKSFSPHQMVVVTVIIISVLLPMRNRIMSQHYTLQFIAAFHNDKDYIKIPVLYHEQWPPHYPDFARFDYDGASY